MILFDHVSSCEIANPLLDTECDANRLVHKNQLQRNNLAIFAVVTAEV